MKTIIIALAAVIALPALASAGDYKCRSAGNGNFNCRDRSLFSDGNPAQDFMNQQMQQHNEMHQQAVQNAYDTQRMLLELQIRAYQMKMERERGR